MISTLVYEYRVLRHELLTQREGQNTVRSFGETGGCRLFGTNAVKGVRIGYVDAAALNDRNASEYCIKSARRELGLGTVRILVFSLRYSPTQNAS